MCVCVGGGGAVLKGDCTGPKGCAGTLRRMLMRLELGLLVCRAVSLLRGCWERIVSECGTKTDEENIKI